MIKSHKKKWEGSPTTVPCTCFSETPMAGLGAGGYYGALERPLMLCLHRQWALKSLKEIHVFGLSTALY